MGLLPIFIAPFAAKNVTLVGSWLNMI